MTNSIRYDHLHLVPLIIMQSGIKLYMYLLSNKRAKMEIYFRVLIIKNHRGIFLFNKWKFIIGNQISDNKTWEYNIESYILLFNLSKVVNTNTF